MIRTIVKSNENNLTLTLPDDMVGKLIEVIAFEIKDDAHELTQPKPKPSQLRGFLSTKSADLMQQHVNHSRAEWDTL
jgi:hypothetical protein